MSMQEIKEKDLVHDEYGNYYEVLAVQEENDKIKALEVANLYFKKSFELTASSEQKGKTIGALIQDEVNGHIESAQKNERPIYSLRDLLMNRIAIYAMDITKPPTENEASTSEAEG